MKSLILILILFSQLINSTSVSQTMYWWGGWCSICDSSNTGDYSCSVGYPTWNDGFNAFLNQVPPDNIVTQITGSLVGQWGCNFTDNDWNATVLLLVDGVQIPSVTSQPVPGECFCTECDPPIQYSWYNNGGCFPHYNYNPSRFFGGNLVQLQIPWGIVCVESLTLTITYEPGDPTNCLEYIPDCPGGCLNGGTCVVDCNANTQQCNCTADYYGPNCQCDIPSYDLTTDHPPVLDVSRSGFLTTDTLYLFVNNSVKYYNTEISFVNQQNTDCDYSYSAGGVTWSYTFYGDTCVNMFEGVIPWADAWPTCLFNRTVTADWITFEGIMIVQNTENLGLLAPNRPFELTRTIVSNLPFLVQYPRFIDLNHYIQVYAPVDVIAAITNQTFEYSANCLPGYGYITLETTVQYPFYLDQPAWIKTSAPGLYPTIISNSVCGDNINQICVQNWLFKITPKNICALTGIYLFNYSIACQPSAGSSCPLDSSTDTGTITMNIESEYFCPQIIQDVDVSGSLESYEDSGHTHHKNGFFLGETIYFEILLNSSKATIINTTVQDFSVILWNSDNKLLYDDGTITAAGLACDLVVVDNTHTPQSAVQAWIQVEINPSVFPVGLDLNEQVNFQVTVDVTYFDTGPVKRTITQSVSGSQSFMANTDAQLTGSYQSSGIINKLNIFLVFLGFMIWLI